MAIHLIHFRGIATRVQVLDAVYLCHALSGQSYTLQVGAIIAWGLIKTEKTNYVELLLEILCYPVELGVNNIILFKLGCCTDDG